VDAFARFNDFSDFLVPDLKAPRRPRPPADSMIPGDMNLAGAQRRLF